MGQSPEFSLYQKAFLYFIKHGHTNGNNSEKLHLKKDNKIVSLRVNDKARVIIRQRNGEWVIISILENHQYDRLEKRTKFSEWLEKQEIVLIDLVEQFKSPETVNESSIQPEAAALTEILDPIYHNDQYIFFDEEQQKVLNLSLPLVITGAPGAGKTTTLPLLITNLTKRSHTLKILYLSLWHFLVKKTEQNWNQTANEFNESSSTEQNHFKRHQIEFKTIQEFYESLLSIPFQPESIVTEKYFAEWFSKRKDDLIKSEGEYKKIENKVKCKHYYNEFRIISGYQEFDTYNTNASERYSIFQKEERQKLWNFYQIT